MRPVAGGRGVLVCATQDWEPQKWLAVNERNAAGQRRSGGARERLDLYQAADKASRKIVASVWRRGDGRQQDLISRAGPARCDAIGGFGSEANGHDADLRGRCRHRRQSLPAHGHARGPRPAASYRTRIDLCDPEEVEGVIFNQRAPATLQADLPTGTPTMMLMATSISRLRKFSTRTKRAGPRRIGGPGRGGSARAPMTDRLLPQGWERCVAIRASPR
jgi:hypothetical protein